MLGDNARYIGPLIVGLVLVSLWLYVIYDVVERPEWEFPPLVPGRERIFWLAVVLFLSGVGALFYYFMVMRPYPRRRR